MCEYLWGIMSEADGEREIQIVVEILEYMTFTLNFAVGSVVVDL
jgi:hypothetical protein